MSAGATGRRLRFWQRRFAALEAAWDADPTILAALFKSDDQLLAESGCTSVEEYLALSRGGEMEKIPDRLRFVGGVVVKHEVGWNGPWPPPERMGIAVGTQTGIVKVFEPGVEGEPAPGWLEEARALGTIRVTVYRLQNASELPDDFASEYVFRGAEYIPEAEIVKSSRADS